MIARRPIRILFCAVIGLALTVGIWSCAKMGAPPGGPEDKAGPRVVETFPHADDINVPRRLTAKLVFSKPVNRVSIESSLFLSPDPRQRLRYHWHGRTLELIYLDSLIENRTYVISVGSQAKDLRGNPAGSSYTLAFSTGDKIDRGGIQGWLGDVSTPQAVSLWAYNLQSDSAPDPLRAQADYRIQAATDATFKFEFIRAGRYRVFAVTDRNFDGLWNPPGEMIGIPPWDVTVRDSTMPWMSFRLAQPDTAPAYIKSARGIHSRLVDVKLDRAVATISASFRLGGDSVPMLDALADTSGLDLWHVFTRDSLKPGTWTINARGIDPFGDPWAASDTLDMRARGDTVRPHIFFSDPTIGSRARLVPDSLRIVFDEPISSDSLVRAEFRLTSGDSDSVNVTVRMRGARELDFIPIQPFMDGAKYRLRFDGRGVRDFSGNAYADSAAELRFAVYSADSLGSVKGSLSVTSAGRYLVRLLTLTDHRFVTQVPVAGPGGFTLDRLPPKKYLIETIRDVARNDSFFFGRFRPFQFSDPFFTSSDTVTVRARWEYDTQVNWRDNP
jgi:hypothetical protein